MDILKKSGASPIYLDVEGENNAANTINGCQLPESVNVQSQKIQFSSASYAITPESQTALESIAEDLKKLPADCLIEIGIHTDNVGDVTKNTQLSMARALALKGFLVNKLGVEDRKLSVKGYGSSEPKVSNDTAEGREANRRTEFRLYTKN